MAAYPFLRPVLRLAGIALAASVLAGGPALLPAISLQASTSAASPAAAGAGIIAYVQRSTYDIRVIAPDGAGDRLLWDAPEPGGRPFPPYDLAWRPDGRELGFSSDHEETCSYYESDIYAIGYDGAGYRRVTNAPDCAALAGLPKGSVEVNVSNGAGPLAYVYVQGAPGARFAQSGTMTFDNVADFGPGVLQRAVGIYTSGSGEYRTEGYPPYADVQPGQTAPGGTLEMPGIGYAMFGAGKVSWNADGSALAFGMRTASSIKQIPASPPYGATGQPLPVVQHAAPSLVAWGPDAGHSDLYLYASKDDPIYLDVAGIYLNTTASPGGGTLLVPINAYYGAEEVYDIEWLPDASGFLFTKRYNDLGTFTDIFEYNLGTQKVTQLKHFPDDQGARGISISPDGQQIVFEWVTQPWDPTSSLWIINRDGSGLRKLADDAGRPAWGRVPSAPASTATPTATASRTPTRTATPTPTATATATRPPGSTATSTPTATRIPGASRVYLPLVLKGSVAAPATSTPTSTSAAPVTATPTRTPTATPTATATAPPANDGIHGRVTYQGAAAPGIALQLRFYDGAQTTTAATTTTDGEGRYRFMGAASLGAGQEYWVRFRSPDNPQYISIWQTASITAYTSGDFDIADVGLLSPPPGAAQALPVTFTWQRRNIPGDTYRVVFFDLDTGDYWYTPDLGDVGSFTATGLWEEAVYGKQYGWVVWVFSGPDSFGESYYYREITFLAGGKGAPAAPGEWQTGEGLREPDLIGK